MNTSLEQTLTESVSDQERLFPGRRVGPGQEPSAEPSAGEREGGHLAYKQQREGAPLARNRRSRRRRLWGTSKEQALPGHSRRRWLWLWGTCICVAALLTATRVLALETIIIERGYDNPTKIAVVPFETLDSTDAGIAEIVSFDLARSGQFDPLPRENMLSFPARVEDVLFRDWRILGIEYVVIGRLRRQPNGDFSVAYHLLDVFNEQELTTRRIGAQASQLRDVAHSISDEVYKSITGIPGAFSTKILYVLAKNAGTSYATYELKLADSDGARARTLFESTQPLLSSSWAPDGRRVAYVSFESGRQSIVIQDIHTGSRLRVAEYRGLNSAPVFSPDGNRLALVLSRDGNAEIYIKDLLTGELRRITRYPSAIDTEPSWTPDGTGLIFTSDRGGQPQIYRMDLTNSMVERLTFEGDYNARARLLPDGKNLVYVHRRERTYHIARQNLERDDGVRVLTATSLDESPSIAPNGQMLIYATQDRGRGILAVVSIDGRVKYRLPASEGDVREPAWSPYMDAFSPGT